MDNGFHLSYHSTNEQGLHQRQGSPHQVYHGYRQIAPSAIEPAMQHHRYSISSTKSARMAGSASPMHVRQNSTRSVQSSPRMLQSSPNLQRTGTPTSTVGRAAYSMSPPPLFDSVSKGSRTAESHSFDDPALPSREITDANIDDAYVKFILFANPAVPRNVDTTELRRVFRAPPKSDGRSFSIFTLWQLIKKLENKELKTWSQLAIELGVEPPSAEKGQSAQKIQQYAVRLKRWMRAMHIDAFFEFCLGKPHRYYTELPTTAANSSEEGRDGVPLDEDLALRALMPEWRPKRGRKKNEERDAEHSAEQPAAKRPHVESHHSAVEYDGLGVHSAIFPTSTAPWTAYQDDIHHDSWTVAPGMSQGQNMLSNVNPPLFHGRGGFEFSRWRRDGSPSGYPQSAITLGQRQPETVFHEPRSAITPSSSLRNNTQSRRRHGPAVSSAWPSQGTATGGKQRGRPPAQKTTQDEPQSAVLPNTKMGGSPNPPRTPQPEASDPPPGQSYQRPAESTQSSHCRPNKLQLQVPERLGGPVRLATPPLVLVNGNGHLRRHSIDYFQNPGADDRDGDSVNLQREKPSERINDNDFTIEDVARAFATRLLRVKIIGRPVGLSVDEAHMVASKAVLSICGDVSGIGPTSSRTLAFKCAIMLGVENEMGVSASGKVVNDCHLSVRSVFQNADGSVTRNRKPESNNISSDANGTKGSYNYTISIDITNPSSTFSSNIQIRDLIVPAQIPSDGMEDEFSNLRQQIKSLSEIPASAVEPPTAVNGVEDGMDDTWRQRFLDVKKDEKFAEERLRRLKRLMLEVVMGSG